MQVAYTSRPPGRTSPPARASSSRWSPGQTASDSGARRKRASGPRRNEPSSEHGASTSTRSTLKSLGRLAEHLEAGHPGPGAPLEEPVEPLGHRIVDEQPPPVLQGRAELERLAPRPGAQVQHALPGPGPDEQAEQLTALVLDLEEPLLQGGESIEVGLGTHDVEGEGTERTGPGLDALGAQACLEDFTRGAQGVHAQGDGPRDIEMGAEVLGGGAEFLDEVLGEPVRQGAAQGEGGGRLGHERPGRAQAREPGGALGGETHEPVEQGIEERGGGRLGLVEEEGEPAAPQGDIEDSLGEGLALLAREGAVGAQGPVQDALRGEAGEDGGEGLGGDGGQSLERVPGNREKPGERVETGC